MEVRRVLSLFVRVGITFLVIGGTQMGAGLKDGGGLFQDSQQSHQHLTLNNDLNSRMNGGDNRGASSRNNEEETDDIASSGPTDNPLDFSRAENKLNMSFGQAVVLAKEETKCLLEFGSQKNKTAPSTDSTNGIPDEGFIIPFGCYRSETSVQCEQCKNLTSRPISSMTECHYLCDGRGRDLSCNTTCFRVYQALRNDSGRYERLSGDILETLKKSNSLTLGEYLRDNITKTVYTVPDDENSSNLVKGSGKSGNEIPLKFLPSPSIMRQQGFLIDSPQVFCEAVDTNSVNTDFSSTKQDAGYTKSGSGVGGSSSINDVTSMFKTHYVLLKWNINQSMESVKPLIFVIEQQVGNNSEWKTIGKTPFGLQAVNVSYQSDAYRWRITAVGPNGIEDVAQTEKYVTLDGFRNPNPPKKIYVVKEEVKNFSVNVLIGWEPPDEKSCFYKIVVEGPNGEYRKSVRIRDRPIGVHQYWFQDLRFGTVYHVRMTSRNLKWHDFESNLTKLEFKTPTCLESFNFRFNKCAPPPPREIRTEINIQKDSEQHAFQVKLSWLPPQNTSEANPILKYLVEISSFNINNPTAVHRMNLNELNNTLFANLSPLLRNTLAENYTVPGNTTGLTIRNLRPDRDYTVMVIAFSERGGSPRAQHNFNTRLAIKAELTRETVSNWIYVTVTLTIAVVLLLMCNAVRIYVHKRNVKLARNQYFQSMEERDETGADWSIVPLTDDSSNWKLFDENFPKEKWEISWDELTMAEVIGQGAFGVVRRAKLHRKRLEAKLKFRGEDETWFNSADRNVDEADPEMETVAVKMVKVSSTRDDREQLIKEITMMQNLGFHSQIVGLLGACTKGRTLCLVLEYCPGGDLLTFIRKVRAKYWPTLGLSESKDRNSPLSGKRSTTAPGMTFCGGGTNSGSVGTCHRSNQSSGSDNRKSFDSSPINYADIGGFSVSGSCSENSSPVNQGGENSRRDFPCSGTSAKTDNSLPPLFKNDIQEDDLDDDEFRPIDEKDVLSYARQIAMGMEYLEKNRVVHRDLACRNILLMGDYKHCKISDFGLSRDIYTWNVYHQKSNGKLPIKWMAIESIFTHVFTTKSDVWSYGILLWELVTLGGTPYPGLGNTELFHLLKSGYRMERPDNCSEELFAVMKKCWRTAAASRPNFTELRRHIETMMEAAEPNLYLSLMADLPVDYFQLSSRSDIPLVGKEEDNLATPLRDSPMGAANSQFHSRHNSSKNGTSDYGSINSNFIPGSSHASSRRKNHSLYHNTSNAHHHPHHKGLESVAPTPCGVDDCNCNGDAEEHSKSCAAAASPYQNKDIVQEFKRKSRSSVSPTCSYVSNAFPSTSSTAQQKDFDSKEIAHLSSEMAAQLDNTPNSPKQQATSHSLTRNNSANSSGKVVKEKALLRLHLESNHQQSMMEAQDMPAAVQGTPLGLDKLLSPDSGILVQRSEDFQNVHCCDSDQVSLDIERAYEGEAEADNNDEEICGIAGRDMAKPIPVTTPPKARALTPPPPLKPRERTRNSSPRPLLHDSCYKSSSICNQLSPTGKNGSNLTKAKVPQSQQLVGEERPKPKLTLPFVNINDMTIIENRTYDLADA